MSPEALATSEEDRRPLMVMEDMDFDSPSSSSVENLMEQSSLQVDSSSTTNPFASFDEAFYNKSTSRSKRARYYLSVGELLWQDGQMYSDVRLTFEDRGILATRAGIPSELRLHSLVLFQSQFFKEQLSVTSVAASSSPGSNIIKEKQIIVRLPSRVTEEDMTNFYCTLKLMYTKNWDAELANNLTKGVGCLSVCCEIGFHEGIEACWKWLAKKCDRDGNDEMMKRLIEAYPSLHEQFTEPEEKILSSNSNLFNQNSSSYLSVPSQKSSSKAKRTPPTSRHSSRRSRKRTNSNGNSSFGRQSVSPMLKSNRRDTLISSDSSASPRIRYEKELPLPPPMSISPPLNLPTPSSPSLPSPPLSNSSFSPITSDNSPTIPKISTNFPSLPSTIPPSIFNNADILNTWITNFETYAISSKRACSKMSIELRQDAKCFPFLEHFVSIFDSINQLGRAKHITSPDALDYTLRMLNVIKIEHAHFHNLHMPSKNQQLPPSSPKSPNKSRPTSPRPTSPRPSPRRSSSQPSVPHSTLSRPTSPRPLSTRSLSPRSLSPSPNSNNTPPIVLHESLDDPLSQIIINILAPIEQKHLCDYLWAPSNISNLMHLREIRSDDDEDMEDEFDGYDQVMGEISLVKASRVSKVEHMVVGEKMAKIIRDIRSNTSNTSK